MLRHLFAFGFGGLLFAAALPAAAQRKQLDKGTVYSVPIDGDPFEGPADAKVTIVEVQDFACPWCLKIQPKIAELRAAYPNDVRVVFKNFVVHQNARALHLGGCAAHLQGKFYAFVPQIWAAYEAKNMAADKLVTRAEAAGLDVEKFEKDMNSDACAKDVDGDQQLMTKVGVQGTPTVFINGRPHVGGGSLDNYKTIIDEELARVDAFLKTQKKGKKKGPRVTQKNYYQQKVVKEGKKEL